MSASQTVETPMDVVRLFLDENVFIKLRGNRELTGKLHSFDDHLNLVIGDAEETVYTTDLIEETNEEISHSKKRSIPMLFVRGDAIVLISQNKSKI